MQVQFLALKLLTAWAAAGGAGQCALLSSAGLSTALAQLAMDAVQQGEAGRQLQKAVCRWVNTFIHTILHLSVTH